jgi:type VI secretion system protein ImpK
MNMDLPRYQGSYLLTQFREFYREMDRLKRLVVLSRSDGFGMSRHSETEAQPRSVATSGPSGGGYGMAVAPALSPVPDASSAVWQQLLTLLERQAFEAGQTGGAFAYEVYREAQYVMAALADEVFLNLNWEGKESWPLLESRLFQTHYAGEMVFERLERLLQRRDPFYLDLAAVYFMALSLEFKGKYRDHDKQGRLQHYRNQLFAMIYRRNPQLFTSSAPLFPQALQHTLDEGSGRRLPDRRVWLLLTGGVVVAWLALSALAWSSVNSSVSCLICKVMNTSCACDTGGGK